jgi:hypothetical protein
VVGCFVDANLQQIIQTTKSFFQKNNIYDKKNEEVYNIYFTNYCNPELQHIIPHKEDIRPPVCSLNQGFTKIFLKVQPNLIQCEEK